MELKILFEIEIYFAPAVVWIFVKESKFLVLAVHGIWIFLHS